MKLKNKDYPLYKTLPEVHNLKELVTFRADESGDEVALSFNNESDQKVSKTFAHQQS